MVLHCNILTHLNVLSYLLYFFSVGDVALQLGSAHSELHLGLGCSLIISHMISTDKWPQFLSKEACTVQ